MKVGDLVEWTNIASEKITATHGVIVGFNEKGEGGKEFVHVLCEGEVHIFMDFDIKVINPNNKG